MKKGLALVAVLAALGTWGYLKFGRKATTETPATTQAVDPVDVKKTFHLYAMSDYFPVEVLKRFETENNCEVRYDNFASNEELLAKLQAGATGYDLIVPSDYVVRALMAGGFLLPIDRDKVPNIENLAPEFVGLPYDKENQFTIPYTWGTTGLIVNTAKVKGAIDSWDVVFKKEVKGHLSLLDDTREVFVAMLRSAGKSANTTDETALKAAQEKLKKLKPSVRLFSSDPKQHVLSGDVWVAHIYSGDALQITKEKPELKYVVPKEGGVIWIDNLAIPKGAANLDLAHKFINLILDAEVGAQITEELQYSSPNKAAEAKITDAKLKASQLKTMPKDKLEFLEDLGQANETLDRLWTEAKSL